MHKELIRMINEGVINVHQYFTMSSYSAIGNTIYSEIDKELDFFKDINLLSSISYERLAVLAKIAHNKLQNTLIITGYRGSGKSNFLRFCNAVISKKATIQNYKETYTEHRQLYKIETTIQTEDNDNAPDFFDENPYVRSVNELAKIKKVFDKSIQNISEILENEFKYKNEDEIRNEIADYLNEHLHGEAIYIDFDEGKRDKETPLELKLTRHIEKHIEKISSIHVRELFLFYNRNKNYFTDSFENRSEYLFEKALVFINDNIEKPFEEYKGELLIRLTKLELDQMLALEVLLEMSGARGRNIKGNLFYLLDNLDMISGLANDVLIYTITKFWDFTREMHSFINFLRNDKETLSFNQEWIDIYNKVVYVFAMRETTAMHIGDHLRGQIEQYAEHFDMSSDVNKSFIIKKRYNLLQKYIDEGKITNDLFIATMNAIESITEDKYYKWSLFAMFNDDYRTAILCLFKICMETDNLNVLYKETDPLLRTREGYKKFGGRGIIIKTLCDSFRGWGYFESLNIGRPGTASNGSRYNITLIRIILTVLQNLQKEHSVDFHFFVDREESVSIKDLYEKVSFFCSEEMFINCIKNMFSIRKSKYWNHLITFDNMLEYSDSDIKLGISGEKDIYIRCTEIGEMYLKILCIHYEFFASRNRSSSKGLFCKANYQPTKTTSKKENKYIFENQVQEVFNKVAKCCKSLYDFNKSLLEHIGGSSYEDILESDYVKDQKFHEERIIHNHISYLDAYRLYLINGPLSTDVVYINKRLTVFIDNYLELLKGKGKTFYSENSRKLYDELKYCIKIIAEIHNYDDKETVISRESYEVMKKKYNFADAFQK